MAVGKSTASYPLDISGNINTTSQYLVNGTNLLLDTPLLGNATATTQIASDNSSRVATTAYVQSRIDALVGGADGALDTLNELATALGNNASFSTTITNTLAEKASKTYVDSSVNSLLGFYYKTADADLSINSVLASYYKRADADLSINSVLASYVLSTTLTSSYYTRSAIDMSINGYIYNKTTIDGSINSILGYYSTKDVIDGSLNLYYTKTAIDASINGNIYNKTTIDGSINKILGFYSTKDIIDGSLGLYYTMTAIDASINGNIYNKTTIDGSINKILGFYSTKDVIDGSLGLYYTKTAIDASINGNIYNKTTIDGSINKILGFYSTKDIIDGSLGLYYTKTAIDASINGNIYNKTTIDGSINKILGFYSTKDIIDGSLGLYYTKTAIDASINGNIYNKTTIDGSINKILGFYSTKDIIDGSLGLYYTKTAIDASINGNIYNKTTIDGSINSLLGFYTTTVNMNNRFDSTDLSINNMRADIQSIAVTGSARDPSINDLYLYNTTQDTSINSLPTKNIIDNSLGLYYTKTAIDASINDNIYNKTTIDSSINSILGFYYNKSIIDNSLGLYYTKTTIDASINDNIYNKTTIDGSINSILGFYSTKDIIDNSLGLYYTKTVIDASINDNIYNKTTIDGSINSILGLYYTKTVIDASINDNIYNKTTIDSSINSILGFYTTTTNMNNRFDSTDLSINNMRADIQSISNTGSTRDPSINDLYLYNTTQDTSINSLPTKSIIDGSLGLYYTKTAIDASINDNIYNKTTIDGSINSILGLYYTKTAIDVSINDNIYNKTTIDGSINSILGLYYTKTAIDASINGNIYNKTTIDGSINSILLKYASLQTDVSFAGNIQMGTTRTISVGINKTPSTAYALDVNGTINATNILLNGAAIGGSIPGYSANTFSFDTSFNGNVQIGSATSTRSLGINCAPNPIYSLDVSGDVRITETGLGTAASATAGTLVLSHTTTAGRSSITFTSPNTGGDYGYIQYYDNINQAYVGETSGGLMVIGVENKDGSGNTSDRISLYADAGTGNVGVNTLTPEYHLDVSGTLRYSAVCENLVPITPASSIITVVYGVGDATINGMVRYINTAITTNHSVYITNLPLILNRSYVFTFIYNSTATTNYINAVRLAFAGVATPTVIPAGNIKGTITAPTVAVGFFIQQFYVFIISTTIDSNIVFQTLTS